MKYIALVLGTARRERQSEKVAKYLLTLFESEEDVSVTFVDVRDHVKAPETIPPWGEKGTEHTPTKWQSIAKQSDVFVFVIPEYNHGYPGEWKLLVDSLYEEYAGKEAFVVGVSNGTFSGVRVADHVKPVLVELGLVVQRSALYIGHVDDVFEEDGEPRDEKLRERASKFITTVCQTILNG